MEELNLGCVEYENEFLCRLCAEPNRQLLAIYGKAEERYKLARKINKLLQVEVSKLDTLPLHVCKTCATSVIYFDRVYSNCLAAEKKILDYMSQHTNADILPPEDEVEEPKDEDEGPEEMADETPSPDDHEDFTHEDEPVPQVETETPVMQSYGQMIFEKIKNLHTKPGDDDPPKYLKNLKFLTSSIYNMLHECPHCKCLYVETDIENHTKNCSQEPQPFVTLEPKKQEKGKKEITSNAEKQTENKTEKTGGINAKALWDRINTPDEVTEAESDGYKFKFFNNAFVCTLCGTQVRGLNYFVRHAENQCPFPHFKCENCDFTTHFKHIFETHTELHTSPKWIVDQCEKIDGAYVCFLCRAEFPLKRDFHEHASKECPFPHYKCKICNNGIDYGKWRSFRNHLINHSTINNKSYVCDVCSMKFTRCGAYDKHKLTHLPPKYNCDKCGKLYRQKEFLNHHMAKVHGDTSLCDKTAYKYVCDICARRFKHLANLHLHTKYKHNSEQLVKDHCEKCGKEFKDVVAKRQHETRRLCDPFRYKVERNKPNIEIKKPLRIKPRNFKCLICSRGFYSRSLVRKHMAVHSENKNYTCKVCGKTFKFETSMKRCKLSHGEKSYGCDRCERRFLRPSDLKYHMFSHSEKSSFVCECGKAFRYPFDLVNHRRKAGHNGNVEVEIIE